MEEIQRVGHIGWIVVKENSKNASLENTIKYSVCFSSKISTLQREIINYVSVNPSKHHTMEKVNVSKDRKKAIQK